MSFNNLFIDRSIPSQAQIKKFGPMLAMLALALAGLACINTELTLTVTHQENVADSLDVQYQQYLIPSYVEEAIKANQERAVDFTAAGRDPGEPILPTSSAWACWKEAPIRSRQNRQR